LKIVLIVNRRWWGLTVPGRGYWRVSDGHFGEVMSAVFRDAFPDAVT
jgi:hypothetical protein